MPRENRKRGKKHKKNSHENDEIKEQPPFIEEEPHSQEPSQTEPSWILPASKQEDDHNPEAPFGFVDVDVKAYFRTVDVQIRDWQAKNDDTAGEGDIDPNESSCICLFSRTEKLTISHYATEKRLFFMAALNEMHGKEKQLATDPDCSVVLERISYSMDDFVRRVFVDSLAGSYVIHIGLQYSNLMLHIFQLFDACTPQIRISCLPDAFHNSEGDNIKRGMRGLILLGRPCF